MKTAFSILVLLLLTFSGIAFAQEVESSPAPESTAAESSPASVSVSESSSESSDATPAADAPESVTVESNETTVESPADVQSETVEEVAVEETVIDETPIEEAVIEDTPVEETVIQEDVIDVSESVPGITPVPTELVGPVIDSPSDKEGTPVDDVTITNIIPVGPVTDASDDEIVVTPGPTIDPCVPSGPCGGDRPPHMAVEQGPVAGKPCPLNKAAECNSTDPTDDDTPVEPTGNENASSNNSSNGVDDDALFHPAWNPFTGVGVVVAPPAEVTQLVTPTPETVGTLAEEGPDPAIVALADGRPKPPVLVVNEIPASSPATGLFTGANASLIGTGILLLLGAFVIFRSRKN